MQISLILLFLASSSQMLSLESLNQVFLRKQFLICQKKPAVDQRVLFVKLFRMQAKHKSEQNICASQKEKQLFKKFDYLLLSFYLQYQSNQKVKRYNYFNLTNMRKMSTLTILVAFLIVSSVFCQIVKIQGEQRTQNLRGASNENNGNDNGNGNGNDNGNGNGNGNGKGNGNQNDADKDLTFDQFKTRHGKAYGNSAEQQLRKAAFQNNKNKFLNAQCTPCGLNSLADRTQEELDSLLGFRGYQAPLVGSNDDTVRNLQTVTIPSTMDWRTKNVVTPVKDQGQCGSCWAFASVALFESQLVRRSLKNNTVNLAEQYLLECDTSSSKCNGGRLDTAIKLGLNKTIPQESTYPYSYTKSYNSTSQMCTVQPINTQITATTLNSYFSNNTRKTETQMKTLLLQRPIAISLCANDFQKFNPTYVGQVLTCAYNNSYYGRLHNHAVFLVGYTANAWIIKNSWSTGWGNSGYVYVNKTANYDCGIGFSFYSFNYQLPNNYV